MTKLSLSNCIGLNAFGYSSISLSFVCFIWTQFCYYQLQLSVFWLVAVSKWSGYWIPISGYMFRSNAWSCWIRSIICLLQFKYWCSFCELIDWDCVFVCVYVLIIQFDSKNDFLALDLFQIASYIIPTGKRVCVCVWVIFVCV